MYDKTSTQKYLRIESPLPTWYLPERTVISNKRLLRNNTTNVLIVAICIYGDQLRFESD